MRQHRSYPSYHWAYSELDASHDSVPLSHMTFLGLRFDPDGYLIDSDKWDENLAEYLADRAGWPLTRQRWAIIHALRESYQQHGGNPTMRHVCHYAHLDRHCIDTYFEDHGRDVWRIAGLPNPGAEVEAYLQ